jgi:multidrug efflux pump subunit AcrB
MGGAMGGSSMGGDSASAMMAMMGGASAGEEDAGEEEEEEDTVHRLHEFATLETTDSLSSIRRKNLTGYLTVSASLKEGYNTTLLSRELQKDLDAYEAPRGYTIEIEGEASQVRDMLKQMIELILLAFMFIYMVMVAEFQSLLSPFIIIFTIPLAFTGGMLGLIAAGEQLSLLSLMGFAILMGTVVNNGIVFVDYANELRKGGLERRDALVSTGLTRMRPILMTALTTILAMSQLIFGSGMGSQMGRGMAIVIAGGLIYGTLMTLYIIPIMYDILFRRQPQDIDTGDDMDEAPDDAAEFLEQLARERAAEA